MTAHLALLAAMLIWSSSFVAMKYAFAVLDPWLVVLMRLLLGGAVMLCWWPHLKERLPGRDLLPWVVLMALCEPCLYFVFEALALQYTSATEASMIVALLPLTVAVAARILLAEPLTLRALCGFIVSLLGAVLLSLNGQASTEAPWPLFGNAMQFLAMLCATGFTLCLRRLAGHYSPLALIAFQVWIGSLFFFPFYLLFGQPFVLESILQHPGALLATIYLGLFVTLLAYGLFTLGVHRASASQAAAYTNLIPVFTLLLAFVLLEERLNSTQGLCCALIVVGLVLSQWDARTCKNS